MAQNHLPTLKTPIKASDDCEGAPIKAGSDLLPSPKEHFLVLLLLNRSFSLNPPPKYLCLPQVNN